MVLVLLLQNRRTPIQVRIVIPEDVAIRYDRCIDTSILLLWKAILLLGTTEWRDLRRGLLLDKRLSSCFLTRRPETYEAGLLLK